MKSVSADEFSQFKFVSDMQYSPEGSRLCFVVSAVDMEKNDYTSDIYTMAGKKPLRLTGDGKSGAFLWLDEDTVLFAAQREKTETPPVGSTYYALSLKGGEAQKKFTFPIPVSNLIPLTNGDFICTGTVFPGYEDLYKGDKKLAEKYKKESKENEDYETVTAVPWWWNGATYTKGAYDILFRYDVKKNRLTPLTELGYAVSSPKLSPDGQYIYYFSDKNVPLMDMYSTVLKRLCLRTGEEETVFTGSREAFFSGYELGESFGVLLLADNKKMGGNTNPDFFKLDYATKAVTPYAAFGEGIGSSVGSDIRRGGGYCMKMRGDTLYFISTLFDSAYLMKLENGKIEKVLDKEGSADCFDISKKGELVLSALFDMKGVELYDGKGRQLTRFNEKVLNGKYLAVPERCDAENAGHSIHGFVIKPMDYDPGKKYPVILDIHGGPKTVYGPVYYHEMQYWAGKGYFVIFCNPTGSDGRGNDFANINGKYGTVDFDDIMAFTDTALAAYPAMDETRLFETGGSYGGFMTNWIVGHTDRFRAVATQRSISNWFSFFGVSDIGSMFAEDQILATPWREPEKLWQHSPMKYIDACKTPVLLIHSLEDYRCPVDQGYQMFSSLIAHGVEARLVLFKGENHDLSRTGKPKHRVKRLSEITDWFDKHLD